MPKSKVIDVRPKKRKTVHKSEQSNTPVVPENPKKLVTHNGNILGDKIRLSKAKSRGHGEKHFLSELHFGKNHWLLYFGAVLCAVLGVVLVSTGVHRWLSWRQAQSIKTPLSLPLVISEDPPPDLFWGTYRPGFYFGLKHRSPRPLIFGLIWTVQDIRNPRFRHVCDPYDGVLRQVFSAPREIFICELYPSVRFTVHIRMGRFHLNLGCEFSLQITLVFTQETFGVSQAMQRTLYEYIYVHMHACSGLQYGKTL